MKSRFALLLVLAAAFVPAIATAQNQSDKPDPLVFVKITTDVADNLKFGSLAGFLGIYVSEDKWADGLKDSDLGPFLKQKEAKPGRSAAFLFSQDKASAICVYFDGNEAFGVAAVKVSGSIKETDIVSAYKPVSKDMLKKEGAKWDFQETAANTDAGATLPAFVLSKP